MIFATQWHPELSFDTDKANETEHGIFRPSHRLVRTSS